MTICEYCNKQIEGLSWNCKRCHEDFCDDHRLPEDHDCNNMPKKGFKNKPTKQEIEDAKQDEIDRKAREQMKKNEEVLKRHYSTKMDNNQGSSNSGPTKDGRWFKESKYDKPKSKGFFRRLFRD